jgi:hypothetical protein
MNAPAPKLQDQQESLAPLHPPCVDPSIGELLQARNKIGEEYARLDAKLQELTAARSMKLAVSASLAAEEIAKIAGQIQIRRRGPAPRDCGAAELGVAGMKIIPHVPGTLISEPGIYAMALEEYHSQCCVGPSVSSSGLRKIFDPNSSPAIFGTSPRSIRTGRRREKTRR